MWKYLKYFIPLLFLCLSILAIYLVGVDDNEQVKNQAALLVTITPIIIASWFFYFTKKEYKYAIFILLSLFLGVSPYLLKALDLIDVNLINEYFWDKRMGLWYFTMGSCLASIFYVLRFYQKPKQDVFSTLKLLLVLLATILLLVNMLIVADEKIHMFSAGTVILLLAILCMIHIADMIIWERKNEKSISDLDSFDNMIEEISGK